MILSVSNNEALMTAAGSQYAQGTAAAQPAKEATQKAPAQEIKAVYGDHDIVEISEEGATYARQAAAAKVSQNGTDATTAKVNASAVSSTAKVATDTAVKGTTAMKVEETDEAASTAAASEETDESDDLSDYTDAELKQMMYKGDITRSEYDEEMLSRNGVTVEAEE